MGHNIALGTFRVVWSEVQFARVKGEAFKNVLYFVIKQQSLVSGNGAFLNLFLVLSMDKGK